MTPSEVITDKKEFGLKFMSEHIESIPMVIKQPEVETVCKKMNRMENQTKMNSKYDHASSPWKPKGR